VRNKKQTYQLSTDAIPPGPLEKGTVVERRCGASLSEVFGHREEARLEELKTACMDQAPVKANST